MLILPRVCADFYDQNRNLLFKITQDDLGMFLDAPERIMQDPLFQMLADEGSIRFPEDALTKKKLENDPMAGSDAAGREIKTKTSKPRTEAKAGTKTDRTRAGGDGANRPIPIGHPQPQSARLRTAELACFG